MTPFETRIYRALLRLYPSSFRAEYRDELETTFLYRTAAMGPAGRCVAAIADVVPNALVAHGGILRADLRHTGRLLARSPGFAVTVVLVVALGVGANTAAFSVADFVLVRPLPFPEPHQLVKLWERTPGISGMELSPANFVDWKHDARSFSAMSAYTETAANLTGSGEPRRIAVADAQWDLFATLGVHPELGHDFVRADSAAQDAVILSDELWRTDFGGDPSILGRRVQLDGAPYTVIGVMPPTFHFPTRDVQLWRPLAVTPDNFADRTNNYLNVIARLAPGATLSHASSELGVIAARLEREYPKENAKTGALVVRLSDDVSDRSRLLLVALCGAALCILLLACANLASLLLARAVSREREMAVRAALGAGWQRLVRQMVTESAVLSGLGGVLGVLVAVAAVPALSRLVPNTLPIAERPAVDLRVLGFAGLLVLVTSLAFSVVPALRSGRADAMQALRDDARSGGGAKQRVRAVLVMIEVMASVVLLISAGLLMRAVWRIQAVDPGFRTENVVRVRTALAWPHYDATTKRARFYTAVLDGVRQLPGVTSAAYVTGLPMEMRGGIWPVSVAAAEVVRSASNSASVRFATPGYFATLGIPIRQGRDVADTDLPDRPLAAVVSESFAQRYWPHASALGKRFNIALHDRVVVGVVGDVRVRGLERSSEPQVYLPYNQQDSASLIFYPPKDLVIRSSTPETTLLPEVRRIVHDADPSQPVSDVRTLSQVVAGETAPRVSQLRLLAVLAAIALLLSSVGIHGLLSFTVARRSHELGVRMAMGAQASDVARLVMREGMLLAFGGLLPGVAIAFAAARGMRTLLAGVQPNDATTFGVAIALCATATMAGSLWPARRAARMDPTAALRAE